MSANRTNGAPIDLGNLLHPSLVFDRPCDVVNDPDLSLNEKRAILASWASDACAVEAAPALRKAPSGRTVQFDEIMEALQSLDRAMDGRAIPNPPPTARRSQNRNRRRGARTYEGGSPVH